MYLSVVVAALVAFVVVGMTWYGPLFGNVWMKEIGMNPKKKKMTPKMRLFMLLGFIATLITAYVLKAFILVNPAAYISTAIWIWLGFVAATQVGSVLWEGRSWKFFAINTGYSLVSILVMAWIIIAMS